LLEEVKRRGVDDFIRSFDGVVFEVKLK